MVQKLSFISLIFQAIPEGIALTALVFAFLKLKLNWTQVAFIGILFGLVSFSIRYLPLSFGVHTVILIFLLSLLIKIKTDKQISLILIQVILSFVILAIGELVLVGGLLAVTKLPWEQVENSQWLRVFFGLPHILLMLVIALVKNLANSKSLSTPH